MVPVSILIKKRNIYRVFSEITPIFISIAHLGEKDTAELLIRVKHGVPGGVSILPCRFNTVSKELKHGRHQNKGAYDQETEAQGEQYADACNPPMRRECKTTCACHGC
jgi:hypothetical protein